MPTRTLYTPVASEVLTAANLKRLANGLIGYETGTAANIGTTEVDICSVTVTVPADRCLFIFGIANITGGGTAVGGNLFIEEGSTDLGRVHRHPDSNAQSYSAGHVIVNGPSAGSHTYKLVGVCDTSGDFDVNVVAARIEVVDVGPSL